MRCYQIMKALTDEMGYLSVSYFMNKLKVSKRTVQNDLRSLKEAGSKNGYELKNMYGKGYFLEVEDKALLERFISGLEENTNVSNEKSLVFEEIYFLLVAKGEFVTVDQMADFLQISKTAAFEKITVLGNYLESYNINLRRKSHYGIKLCGTDTDIRNLMLDMYINSNGSLVKLIDQRIGNFVEIERLTEDCIKEQDLRVGYYEFQRIMCWLKVLTFFVLNLQENSESDSSTRLTEIPDLAGFSQILDRISWRFKISFSPQQRNEFGCWVKRLVQVEDQQPKVIDQEKLTEVLIQFLKKVDLKNGTDFSKDSVFIEQLESHVSLLIGRLDQKIKFKNPMLIELCIKYPGIFDIALEFSTFFHQNFGYRISVDELAFIAVHFLGHLESSKIQKINMYKKVAVVCTTGGGVSNLIKNQIQTIFPNSEVKAYPFWKKDEITRFSPGIVFSAVPLQDSLNVPTIYINELLSSKDLENIRQFLFLGDLKPKEVKLPNLTKEYLQLFDSSCFSVTTNKDYQTLISEMVQDLIDRKYASSKLVENILIREKYMPTVFKNGIAMPHPIEMDAKKSVISVSIVNSKMVENNLPVKIVFLVYLSKKATVYYSQISNALFQLMKSEESINKIFQKPVFQELIKTLSELEG